MMINLQTYCNWVEEKISKSIIEKFSYTFNNQNFDLFIKRDDLIDEIISGNKLRKLKYNIIAAYQNECVGVATFGGAYSNHILAIAFLCKEFNIPLTLNIRGDELNVFSNKILLFCNQNGVKLNFISREKYKIEKKKNGVQFVDGLKLWHIPEGGANEEGIKGAREILKNNHNFDTYLVAQGTTTTSIGIYQEMSNDSTLIVVPALRHFESKLEMSILCPDMTFEKQLTILQYEELGRYAQKTETLLKFEEEIKSKLKFTLDPIYTLKALYAYTKYCHQSQIGTGNKKVLFVHTGGLNENWW